MDRAKDLIRSEKIHIKQYDIIIVHIGTTELNKRNTNAEFVKMYQELIKLIREFFPNERCFLGLSFIIQRPKDFQGKAALKGSYTERQRQDYNREIKRLALWERCQYIKSSKPFGDRKNPEIPDQILFSKDGIHLN